MTTSVLFDLREACWILSTAGILLMAWLVVLAVDCGFIPIRSLLSVLRRPVCELVVLAAVVFGFVRAGATKGTNGLDRAEGSSDGSDRGFESARDVAPLRDVVVNANLWFTQVASGTNGVDLALSWTTDYVFSAVGLYHRTSLVSNDCARIDLRTDVANATNCSWTITDPSIVTNVAGFFGARGFLAAEDDDNDGVPNGREIALALDPDNPDSDGDGLSDGEELGYAAILADDDFLWLNSSNGVAGVSHFTAVNGDCGWLWFDNYPVSVQGTDCSDFEAHKDGCFYISRDGNDVWTTQMGWSEGLDLRYDARSGGSVVVAGLNYAMSYGGPGCRSIALVETNGTSYVVYRAEGQDALLYGETAPHAVTYEVIVPFNETNTVYVSYLEVDDAVAALPMDLGVQCPAMRSAINTNEFYTIHTPPGALRSHTTVKYVIGTNTDPRLVDTDGDGIPDGFSPISEFDADGDGLVDELDPEPAVYGGDFHGQSDAWVQATFTNASEILSVGYVNCVDAQVGVGLTNGLYKFTVSVTNAPANPVLISVGDYRVVVTNIGDCVFLLEKGVRIPIGLSGGFDDIAYSCDDGGGGEPGMPMRGPIGSPVYTVRITATCDDGVGVELDEPTANGDGYVLYWPRLSIAPSSLTDPEFPVLLHADVFDIPAGAIPSVVWESGGATLSSWENFMLTGEEDVGFWTIAVTATYRDVVLHGAVVVERHVRENGISLSGGGVVIVEDAYTNAPGEVVSASSTSAALDVSWSLAQAGSLQLMCNGAGVVLTNEYGTVFNLPRTWHGSADEEGYMRLYAAVPDATPQAAMFTLRYIPEGEGFVITRTASLQAVKIRVEAEASWPSNRVRHVFGPKERFTITSNPQVELSVAAGSFASVSNTTVTAPDRGGAFQVYASFGGLLHSLSFGCIVPTALRGGTPRELLLHEWHTIVGQPLSVGEAGVAMHIDTWLEPSYVSFSHLRLYEGYAPTINRTGWCLNYEAFPEQFFQHGIEAGAGSGTLNGSAGISDIGNLSLNGDYVASILGSWTSYLDGSYQLAIPLKWFAVDGAVTNSLPVNMQTVWVFSNGTMRIQKNGVTWERDIDGACRQIEE